MRPGIRMIGMVCLMAPAFAPEHPESAPLSYPVVGTGQKMCYDNYGEIAAPGAGQPFFGQDAQYKGSQPSYRDNGDGSISDLNTGLMWVKARGLKVAWEEAVAGAAKCRIGGHADWRMPRSRNSIH